MDGNNSKLSVQQKSSKGKNKKPLKVVYISNPKHVEASAEQFRALVQKLTGVDSDVSGLDFPEFNGPSGRPRQLTIGDVAASEKPSVNKQKSNGSGAAVAFEAAFDYEEFAAPMAMVDGYRRLFSPGGNSMVFESATHLGGFHGHDIHHAWNGLLPTKVQYPVTDFLSRRSPAQSASGYPITEWHVHPLERTSLSEPLDRIPFL